MALLHSRYGNFYKMPVSKLGTCVKYALDEKVRDDLWQRYLALYPNMVVPSPISGKVPLTFKTFDDFVKEHMQKAQEQVEKIERPKMTKDEIIEKYEKINQRLKQKRGEG